MKGIRIHGRGGQGAVLAAELLAVAALEEGKFGQAFPAFGGERRGAPVQAFVRLDDRPIRLRYRVSQPDYLLILDPSLMSMVDLLSGLPAENLVLVNSEKPSQHLPWSAPVTAVAVPATRIGLEVFGQPVVNPAMLGAFAAATGEVSLAAIQNSFRHRFPGLVGEKNCEAARLGHEWILAAPRPLTVVQSNSPGIQPARQWESSPGLGAPGRPHHFALVVAPRTSLAYPTGAWRYNRPVVQTKDCNGCGLCALYCPDACLHIQDKQAVIDLDYCKGCGICAHECPSHAILMQAEEV